MSNTKRLDRIRMTLDNMKHAVGREFLIGRDAELDWLEGWARKAKLLLTEAIYIYDEEGWDSEDEVALLSELDGEAPKSLLP